MQIAFADALTARGPHCGIVARAPRIVGDTAPYSSGFESTNGSHRDPNGIPLGDLEQ